MWKLFFKGFGIGAASIVPGLSSGIIALIQGIYTRLIGIAGNIDHRTVAGLMRLAVRGRGHGHHVPAGIQRFFHAGGHGDIL